MNVGGKTFVGFLLLWGAYAAVYWGYCLVEGYDITFPQVVDPVHWYSGGAPSKAGLWTGTSILPGGASTPTNQPSTAATIENALKEYAESPQGPLSTTVPASNASVAERLKNAIENALKQMFLGGFR
jgi:hypothetical protein